VGEADRVLVMGDFNIDACQQVAEVVKECDRSLDSFGGDPEKVRGRVEAINDEELLKWMGDDHPKSADLTAARLQKIRLCLQHPTFTLEYNFLEEQLSHKGADRVINLLRRDNGGVQPVTYGDWITDE